MNRTLIYLFLTALSVFLLLAYQSITYEPLNSACLPTELDAFDRGYAQGARVEYSRQNRQWERGVVPLCLNLERFEKGSTYNTVCDFIPTRLFTQQPQKDE